MLLAIESHGAVRLIRMNHADENRFNGPFVAELHQTLDELEQDSAAGALVFTGAHPKFFSNGLDLEWIVRQKREDLPDFILSFSALLKRVFLYPKPVVAAMNGHAFAGGLFLACACDYRVMRRDRGFCCIPEIDLGLDLPPGYIAILEHVVGSRQCELLSLTGKRLTGGEALAIGLIDELADQNVVIPHALAVAADLAKKSAYQYGRHKRFLRAAPGKILEVDDPRFVHDMFAEGRLI